MLYWGCLKTRELGGVFDTHGLRSHEIGKLFGGGGVSSNTNQGAV